MRVLALEAGRPLDAEGAICSPTRSRGTRAPRSASRERRGAASSCNSCHGMFHRDNAHLFVDDIDNPYDDAEGFTWIRARQVGGRSLTWGRIAVRISDDELHAASRDGFGDDWPIGYADLAPYFDRVEEFLGVEGEPAGIANLPDGRYRSAPEPPTDAERWFTREVEARWPERRAIPDARRSRCETQSTRQRGRAIERAQGSTLAAAAATGRLTSSPSSIAHSILLDESGRRATRRARHRRRVPGRPHPRRADHCPEPVDDRDDAHPAQLGKPAKHAWDLQLVGPRRSLPHGPHPGRCGGDPRRSGTRV